MDEKVIKKILTRAKRIVKLEDEIDSLIKEVGNIDEQIFMLRMALRVDHWNIPKLKAMFPDMKIEVNEQGTHGLYAIDMDVEGVPFYEYTLGEFVERYVK